MHVAIWVSRRRETSSISPLPTCAARPTTLRSVSMVTSVPSPFSPTRTVITARADPEPPTSRPSASSTAVRAASSRLTTCPVPW